MGDLNTAGRGWVDPLGVPSAEAMVTVGRVAIFEVIVDGSGLVVVAGTDEDQNRISEENLAHCVKTRAQSPSALPKVASRYLPIQSKFPCYVHFSCFVIDTGAGDRDSRPPRPHKAQ